MPYDIILKTIIALLPVIVLVIVLFRLDSHRLLGTHFMVRMFFAGCLSAIVCGWINGFLIEWLVIDFERYTRFVGPMVEETVKASILIYLFRTNRIGFLIDAGILGFTVGAGFSFVENIYYLNMSSDAHYGVWVVRGFGTAIMHGGATALFAIVAETMTERHLKMNPLLYIPGLIVAFLLHVIFNHFPISPVLSTAVTLLILPTILFLLFERNETTIHNFLEMDFASHRKLLRQIQLLPAYRTGNQRREHSAGTGKRHRCRRRHSDPGQAEKNACAREAHRQIRSASAQAALEVYRQGYVGDPPAGRRSPRPAPLGRFRAI
jgi:RsiW-degrading membrane proteinase PrsW (M82 family)